MRRISNCESLFFGITGHKARFQALRSVPMAGDHPLPSAAASLIDYVALFVLRPFLAFSFVLSFILLGWILAWKLVLVHVPLVQEIFGLRKKQFKPKPPHRHRYSRYYSSISTREGVHDSRAKSSPS